MKKLLTFFLVLAMVLSLSVCGAASASAEETAEEEPVFADWIDTAPALQALIDYVEAVTDEASPDYIPPEDRIAVFDMDGTLCAELCPTYLEYYLLAWRILKDPTYTPDAEMLEFGRMLRDHALDKSFPDGMDLLHATHAAKAYAGMTLQEFASFVNGCLLRDCDGFENMTWAKAFYTPMIEVVDYLVENDFKCYICSGSDRFICRTFIEGMLDIPPEQVIGMDVEYEATNQGDVDGLHYVFQPGDQIIRTDHLLIKNLKMNKVKQIVQQIGKQPVLSFGNSSGDVSMHLYTISDNAYRSAAFMLVADDDVRDYGNPQKTESLKEKWADLGFEVISMRDDFRTIYGDEVVKTGTFTWLEDLAENREAAPVVFAEPVPAEEESSDVQYVLYLGTNDMDTNKPVFTQAEAQEKAKEILIRHFGGYTLQEASGGWVSDDNLYQEYTLIIYLSDTTEEAVHAAADELLETFRQSSILIQSIPSTAEFYSGSSTAEVLPNAA
ncbi:MAG: haloacid dehalogenase-like hydrolase [Oscillospiraceae bacterium]|nr:haloacid dehalogenase-like hydrolase [Oscillospiraceae bacterium]